MADTEAIREALAASLESIPDLGQSPYVLGNPTPPYAEVEPGPVQFDKAMGRGLDAMKFIIRVLMPASLDRGVQKALDRYRDGSGEYSIKAAVEADRTLGGAAADTRVSELSGYKRYQSPERSNLTHLGCEWTVEVFAPGN